MGSPEKKKMKMPDVKMPEFKKPDIKMGEMKKPDIKMPEMKKPDIKMPEFKKPEFKNPFAKKEVEAAPADEPAKEESIPCLEQKDICSTFAANFTSKPAMVATAA